MYVTASWSFWTVLLTFLLSPVTHLDDLASFSHSCKHACRRMCARFVCHIGNPQSCRQIIQSLPIAIGCWQTFSEHSGVCIPMRISPLFVVWRMSYTWGEGGGRRQSALWPWLFGALRAGVRPQSLPGMLRRAPHVLAAGSHAPSGGGGHLHTVPACFAGLMQQKCVLHMEWEVQKRRRTGLGPHILGHVIGKLDHGAPLCPSGVHVAHASGEVLFALKSSSTA